MYEIRTEATLPEVRCHVDAAHVRKLASRLMAKILRKLRHDLPPDQGDCVIAGCHVPAWCRLRPWCDEEVAKRGGRDAETVAALARRMAQR